MRRLSCLAVALAMSACAAPFQTPPIPTIMGSISPATIAAWVASTRPTGHHLLRFHWTYNTDDVQGRGSVSYAGPDSLHLEFRGPLGSSPGSASVVGDSALWAEPADKVSEFVPAYPLLWAMIGMARPAGSGWRIEGRDDPGTAAWRYVRGTDTIAYAWVRKTPAILVAYVRLDDHPIGRVTTLFGADGRPAKARLDVLSNPARLDIIFDKDVKQIPFDRSLWLAPHDP